MVKRSNVEKAIQVLEKVGRITKNQAILAIMREAGMSRQTASDAIDQGVLMNRIFREEDQRGQLRIVWISVSSQTSEIEKLTITQINNLYTGYDEKFELFKNNLNNLTIQERADGIDTFSYFLIMAKILISSYSYLYGQTRKWTNLLKTLDQRMANNQKLMYMPKDKDTMKIIGYVVEDRAFDVASAYEDIEEFMKENKL